MSDINNVKQNEMIKDEFDHVWNRETEVWGSETHNHDLLSKKMIDDKFIVHEKENDNATINLINRAVMTNKYILDKYSSGAKIIDAASGDGFNSCYLGEKGYLVDGFDVAKSGIEKSVKLANKLKLDKVKFHETDHSYFKKVESNSIDVVCALGLMRYLTKEDRDEIYNQANRVLKDDGVFIVSNDNLLFDMFSLNNQSLELWSSMIEGFSCASDLLTSGDVLSSLKDKIQLPNRIFNERSVSKRINKHEENPLTFNKDVIPYGFELIKNFFPDCHLLPPFLEKNVDTKELEKMKGEICIFKAEDDWRSFFFGFEFLSVLKKSV